MPNWTRNTVKVRGTASDVNRFREYAEETDEAGVTTISFRKFLPIPEELKGIFIGVTTIDGERVKLWREKDGKAGGRRTGRPSRSPGASWSACGGSSGPTTGTTGASPTGAPSGTRATR